jgi:hypothetical protein
MNLKIAIILALFLTLRPPIAAFSGPPLSKGHWSYANGKPDSVVFTYGTVLSAEDIDKLSRTTSIAQITLGYAGIDCEYVTVEGDLSRLGKLKNLKEVHLCKNCITNDDLRFIAALPNLHTLEFNADSGYADAPVCTDACAEYLGAANTLRKLVIHDGNFTDAFVATIAKRLPDLEELWLNTPGLTDESLRLLAAHCKQLKTLQIASDHFTAHGLAYIQALTSLEELSVSSPILKQHNKGHSQGEMK